MLAHSSQPRPSAFRERFQQYRHRRSISQQSQLQKQRIDLPPWQPTEVESRRVEKANLQPQHRPIPQRPQRPGPTATEHHRGQRTPPEQQQQRQQQRQQPVPDSHNRASEPSRRSQSARPATFDKRPDNVPRSGGAHRTSQSCDHGLPSTSVARQHDGFGVRRPAGSARGDTAASNNTAPPGALGAKGRLWDAQGRSPLADATILPPLPIHRRTRSGPVAPPRSFERHDNNLLKPPSRFKPLIPALPTATGAQLQRPSYVEELSTFDFILRSERSSARGPAPETSYPDLQTENMESINYSDPDFRMLNRPRKLSSSSSASTGSSASASRETLASRPRSPTWSSSATSFDSMEFVNRRPSEYTYGTSSGGSSPRPYVSQWKPGEIFASLPGEVLELMLDELKKLHLRPGSDSCSTCWMRDLCSISLSSRKWSKFARTSLYEDIQLNGPDSTAMKKRYKACPAPRLVLLRRTLRSSRQIAVIAHSLKVPLIAEDMSVDAYHNLVASVVMACPNFERLTGLHPRYNHAFDRLFHALSTRPKLKQMEWIVDIAPSSPRQPKGGSKHITKAPPNLRQLPPLVTPGDIHPYQSAAFLELHSSWTHLTTLTIHALPRGSLAPDDLISKAISRLPSLQHLFLSRLPFSAFKDSGLLSLPALKTLSLSHLPGITCDGLSALATRSSSHSIRRLILRHVNVDEMPALARILSNLVNLENLAFVQSYPPLMPDDNFILLMPYLASKSLRKLHWDITSHPHCANAADSILARSIGAGGLPGLRVLRAPNDPEGLFQSLCSPRDRVDMPGDRFRGSVGIHGRDVGGEVRSLSVPSTPTAAGPVVKGPSTPVFAPGALALCDATDLHRARLAAQARLEAAWRFPRFRVNVIDEDGTVVDKFGLAGFIGDTGSKVRYSLLPDPRAKDENGGLVEAEDIMEGVEGNGPDACNGRWNMPEGSVDKKDRERWWHVERGRWGPVEQ